MADYRFGQTDNFLSLRLRMLRQQRHSMHHLVPRNLEASLHVFHIRTRRPSANSDRRLSSNSLALSACSTNSNNFNNVNPRRRRVGQHFTLGKTLISVSILYLCCHSLKLVPDMYEFIWCQKLTLKINDVACETNVVIEILISLSNLLMCITVFQYR